MNEQVAVPLSTPIPDSELIFLVNGHRDQWAFGAQRRKSVEEIIGLLAEAGVNYADFNSILDFGCGCGRILAGWEGLLDPRVKLHGCDVNEQLIDFCQRNIPFAETKVSNFYPPLPYSDRQFDLVYLASVYTHLNLAAALQWAGEFTRIVKPGGVVFLSYSGTWYAKTLSDVNKDGSRLLAMRGFFVHIHGEEKDTWKGSNSYVTYLTTEFLMKLFCGFELIGLAPGISTGPLNFASYQDIAIMRRRDDV